LNVFDDVGSQDVLLQAWATTAILAETFIVFIVLRFERCFIYLVEELYTHGAWCFGGQCD
jgi:hypothetical protein